MTYKSKSADSFNTRLRFYLYKAVTTNKESLSLKDFLAFDTDKNLDVVKSYTTEYYQQEKLSEISGKTVDEIYDCIETLKTKYKSEFPEWREEYFKQVFQEKFPIDTFKTITNAQQCFYCGITLDQIKLLISQKQIFKKNERGHVMEIDRKHPNMEYSTANCEPSCYWCNNAKTDEFSAEEFKPIGLAIGKALRKRLTEY